MFDCCADNTQNIEISENMKKKQILNKKINEKIKNTEKYKTQYDLNPYNFEDGKNIKIEKSFPQLRKLKILESYYYSLQKLNSYYPVTKFPIYKYNDYYYQGSIESGLKNGYGRMIKDNKEEYYEGEWKNDKFNGFGIKINSNNSYIYGTFKNGLINGNNIIYQKEDEEIYQGNILDGEETGEAIIRYNSHSFYKGTVKNGERNGYGIFINGNKIYKGKFKNGLLDYEKGKLIIKKGNTIVRQYEGNFKDGKLDGKGRIKFLNGEVFEGNFKKGIKEGFGYWTTKDLKIYGGIWKNEKLNGKGIISRNGLTIDVEYENNKIIKNL